MLPVHTKMNKFIKQFFSEQAGITLVELIIAITVMVMMLGITSIYLPTYRASQLKRQAALDLNDSLRFAQSLAASPESGDIEFYHWHYDEDDNLIMITDDSGDNERIFNFDSADKVLVVTDIEDIYIKTKTPVMYSDEALTTEAVGSIQIYHISQTDVDNLYYKMSDN